MSKRKIKMPPEVLKFLQEQGKRNGAAGGKRSLETMTPEERKERAIKASRAAAAAREKRKGKKVKASTKPTVERAEPDSAAVPTEAKA